MVMTTHILFEKIDPKWPATLSEIIIGKLLREEYRYRGVVITDDLGMKALTNNFKTEEIAVRAIIAGVDMLLYCNEFGAPSIALDALNKACKDGVISAQRIDESFQRLMDLKKKNLAPLKTLSWSEAENQLKKVSENQTLADAVARGEVPQGLTPA